MFSATTGRRVCLTTCCAEGLVMRPQSFVRLLFFLLGLWCVSFWQASAEVLNATVDYQEIGGPRDANQGVPVGDLFTITNHSDIGEITGVTITLANGLLFDTDPSNAAGTA